MPLKLSLLRFTPVAVTTTFSQPALVLTGRLTLIYQHDEENLIEQSTH
jgi:hypothetical protein